MTPRQLKDHIEKRLLENTPSEKEVLTWMLRILEHEETTQQVFENLNIEKEKLKCDFLDALQAVFKNPKLVWFLFGAYMCALIISIVHYIKDTLL